MSALSFGGQAEAKPRATVLVDTRNEIASGSVFSQKSTPGNGDIADERELLLVAIDARAAMICARNAERDGQEVMKKHHEQVARDYAEYLAKVTGRLPLMFEACPFLREAWTAARKGFISSTHPSGEPANPFFAVANR